MLGVELRHRRLRTCRPLGRAGTGAKIVTMVSLIGLSACTGSHTEYLSKHPWIGKCATFGQPVAYVTNLPSEFSHEEIVRIGRSVMPVTYAEYLKRLPGNGELVIEPAPTEKPFMVSAVFTVVKEGVSRWLNEDLEVAVLNADDDGRVSTAIISSLKSCRASNISPSSEYPADITGQP